jgi:tetratricopeptide (TPR) repeat protein
VSSFLQRKLLIAVVLCFLAAGAQAQKDADPSAGVAASIDITKPYEPPAASKSVEIGNFYLRRKRYNAALSRFQEAAATDPYYAPAYLGLGKVYEKIGLKQKALDAYHKYLDGLPSEKQADEAKDVHKAVDRLQRDLRKTLPASHAGHAQILPAPAPSAKESAPVTCVALNPAGQRKGKRPGREFPATKGQSEEAVNYRGFLSS